MAMTPLSDEEYLEISASLEDYHGVFYKFLEMSSVFFCEDSFVKTAAVGFPKDPNGKPTLYLNQKFWNGLNFRTRLFIICHECLHVILDHGVRNGLTIHGATPELVNIAQDICINEMQVDLFNFDRNDLQDWSKYCWIDTCFKGVPNVLRNQTFTYYLELLIKHGAPPTAENGGPSLVDGHNNIKSEAEGGPAQEQKEAQEATAKELAEELYAGELEELLKGMPENASQGAGFMVGQMELIIARKVKDLKFKFTHLIKKLKRTSIKLTDVDVESFVRDERRFQDLIKNYDVALPGKVTDEREKKDRLLTAVFMDVSGSCIEYFSTFNRVIVAFEREKPTFDLRAFTFDTVVEEITTGRNARGGGGTKFNIIEEKCLALELEYKRYPDCVILITDGDGNAVTPKFPSRWVWLLTKFPDTKYINPKSKNWSISNVLF